MNRTRIAIVGLALLATACTSGNTGDPKPGTSTEDPPASTSSSNAADGGKLASVQPCELLTSSEATGLGLKGTPEPDEVAGAKTCDWVDANGGLTVSVDPAQGADDFNYSGSTKTPAKFGAYEGFKIPAPQGTAYMCHVLLSVTAKSSVTMVASSGAATTDTDKACDLATKSAELVAAKLP